MDKQNRTDWPSSVNRFSGLHIIFLSICMVCILSFGLFAGGNSPRSFSKYTAGKQAVKQKLQALKNAEQFFQLVHLKQTSIEQDNLFKSRMFHLSPDKKINALLTALQNSGQDPMYIRQLLQTLATERQRRLGDKATGSISGTIDADLASYDVLAFDQHGFFAGIASNETADFQINGLQPGTYSTVLYPKSNLVAKGPERSTIVNSWKMLAPVHVGAADVRISLSSADYGNLKLARAEQDSAAIEGRVWVAGVVPIPVPLALIFAFDLSDSSLAQVAVSSLDIEDVGKYLLEDLDAGSYLVYADTYLSALLEAIGLPLGPTGLQGEYFEDAVTSVQADAVMTAARDTTRDIDFSLEPGGAISGNVTNADGAAMDSILIVAFKQLPLVPVEGSENDPFAAVDQLSPFFPDYLDFGLAITDLNGDYLIPGLADGDYIVRTISTLSGDSVMVLDEFYGGVHRFFDVDSATTVTVQVPDTTKDINFDLEFGGAISGRFVEITDPQVGTQGGGSVFVFNVETGLPELVLGSADSLGNYWAGPLPSGEYKLFALPGADFDLLGEGATATFSAIAGIGKLTEDWATAFAALDEHEQVIYLPQFYDGKISYEEADTVEVFAPAITEEVDFKMVRAGTIVGTVAETVGTQPGAVSADANTVIAEALIAVYDIAGDLVGGTETDENGSYFVAGLLPGVYKVQALVALPGIASGYAGGGIVFDDPNTTSLALNPGETVTADIGLLPGNGAISGNVSTLDGTLPLPGVMVLAYDHTGHATSAGVSGFDLITGEALPDPAHYEIPGLLPGSYFVRTYSLFGILGLAQDLGGDGNGEPGSEEGFDLLGLIFALIGGEIDLSGATEIQLYGDLWYDNIPVLGVDFGTDLLVSLVLGYVDPDLLIPLSSQVPGEATSVQVAASTNAARSNQVDDIDFFLPLLQGLPTSVPAVMNGATVPEQFHIAQNFPNPFNPTTTVTYSLPHAATIELHIYNVLGQRIRTLFRGIKESGVFSEQWDGRNDRGEQVGAGIYFLRLNAQGFAMTRKMMLIK